MCGELLIKHFISEWNSLRNLKEQILTSLQLEIRTFFNYSNLNKNKGLIGERYPIIRIYSLDQSVGVGYSIILQEQKEEKNAKDAKQ